MFSEGEPHGSAPEVERHLVELTAGAVFFVVSLHLPGSRLGLEDSGGTRGNLGILDAHLVHDPPVEDINPQGNPGHSALPTR